MASTATDWRSLLAATAPLLLEDVRVLEMLSPEERAAGTLDAPGANEQQIAAAEARLGVRLPPSYRAFLETSNGWGASNGFAGRLCSAEQVEWYATHNQDRIDSWTQGLGTADKLDAADPFGTADLFGEADELDETDLFGEADELDETDRILDDTDIPPEHLQAALMVSEEDDGVILLNPRQVGPDGEWEAWFLASWIPGVRRARSFWDLMQATLVSLQEQRAYDLGLPMPYAHPALGVDARDFDGLVAALGAPQNNRRILAAQALGQLRDPRALEPLLARLQDPLEDLFVRESAARALGALRDPRAIEPLRDALAAPALSPNQIPLSAMLGSAPPHLPIDQQTLDELGSLSLADFSAQLGQILGPEILGMLGAPDHFADQAAAGMHEHLRDAIRQALRELGQPPA